MSFEFNGSNLYFGLVIVRDRTKKKDHETKNTIHTKSTVHYCAGF